MLGQIVPEIPDTFNLLNCFTLLRRVDEVAWKDACNLWQRLRLLESSLAELEFYLPKGEGDFFDADGLTKRATERMFQAITDQFTDCNRMMMLMDQHFLDPDFVKELNARETFDAVSGLEVIGEDTYCGLVDRDNWSNDVVSVRNWLVHESHRGLSPCLVYRLARRIIESGRQYVRDAVTYLCVASCNVAENDDTLSE